MCWQRITYKQEKYGNKHMLDYFNNLACLFTVQKIMDFFFRFMREQPRFRE